MIYCPTCNHTASSIFASPGMPLLHTASFAGNALKNIVDLHSLSRQRVELLEQSFAQASGNGAHLAERFLRAPVRVPPGTQAAHRAHVDAPPAATSHRRAVDGD